jgi:excisionase family DNA binding protein
VSRAYTVASLAEEWECSEGVIRKAIRDGELGCFRLGTLIRIPAEEVRRFECQNIPSSDSEADTPLSGETSGGGTDASSKPAISLPRKRRREACGRVLQAPHRRLAG